MIQGETGPQGGTGERIVVHVDMDIEDLVPGFLENRREDVLQLREAARTGDFDMVRTLGHRMKGAGGGYGFDRITELGAAIEESGKSGAAGETERLASELEQFLDRVEVVYE